MYCFPALALKKFLCISSIQIFAIFASALVPISVCASATANPGDQSRLFLRASVLVEQQKIAFNVVLIDIRHKKAFDRIKIPGSINIPLHFIKTKPYLKNNKLVLIDKGPAKPGAVSECTRLQKDGYAVLILEGGLYAWVQAGGKTLGDPFAIKHLNEISAADYYASKAANRWIAIDTGNDPRNRLKSLPDAIHVPFLRDHAAFLKQLKSKVTSKTTYTPVLIFDHDGSEYKAIKKVIQGSGIKAVFFLEGGRKAYKTFLHDRALSKMPKNMRIGTTNPCRTCDKNGF